MHMYTALRAASHIDYRLVSDLTVTTGTFKNRLKSALYGRAFLQ